jgi:hypothetical protein
MTKVESTRHLIFWSRVRHWQLNVKLANDALKSRTRPRRLWFISSKWGHGGPCKEKSFDVGQESCDDAGNIHKKLVESTCKSVFVKTM